MIAAVVGAAGAILVTRPDSAGGEAGDPATASPPTASDVASVGDTGPATLILDDPTCEAWNRIARDYVAKHESVGWADRDSTIPASQWPPQLRHTYETVAEAATGAAKTAAQLEKQTPHRVMRELYQQFTVYADAFAELIPTYTAADDPVLNVVGGLLSALSSICGAIDYKAAHALAPLVSAPQAPSAPTAEADNEMFLTAAYPDCPEIVQATTQYDNDVAAWRAIDGKIPATDWTPEQRSVHDRASQVMTARADQLERFGRASDNPVFEDFAVLSAQYLRAYVIAIPNYTSRDNLMVETATYLAGVINWACKDKSS